MLKPLNDHVIIKPHEVENKTSSGIILTKDTAGETHLEGVVIAVGPGNLTKSGTRQEMSVAVGDRVIYGGFSQNKVVHEGEDLIIISEKDILAIVEVKK